MRLQHLDLNLLVSLNALLGERSVAAAAERVNLTPSAMSHALARLRQQFNDDLLTPAGRKLVLTPRAETLVGPVREALLQIERIVVESGPFDPAVSSRRFAILASDYALSVVVAEAVARIKSVAPCMQFEIAHPDDPLLRLIRGDADLIVLPQQHLSPEHPSMKLFDDEYVIVMWAGSSLAQQDIDLDRYFELGHVAIHFGRRYEDSDAVGLAAPRARRIEVTTQSFTLIPHLLVHTNLIATLPRRQADMSARVLPLITKPLPFIAPPIHECVQWSKSRDGDAATAWVVKSLRDCVT
jgi:DNA-binding transcriptional LysR family regulator